MDCMSKNTRGPDDLTPEIPSIRFNYGLPWNSEIVLKTVAELIDNEHAGTPCIKEKQFVNTAGFIKKFGGVGVIRHSILQRKPVSYFPQKKIPLDWFLKVPGFFHYTGKTLRIA